MFRAVFKASLILSVVFMPGCSDPIGNKYKDIDALATAEEWRDWVIVGRFGPEGPFTLTHTKLCPANLPCSFSHSGQGHSYDGFKDFELMILRLESKAGDVAHVVLRGALKIDA